MRKIFAVFSIIICFLSPKYNLSSSRIIHRRRVNGGSSKFKSNSQPRLIFNNNLYHSIYNIPKKTDQLKHSISLPIFPNRKFKMHHIPGHRKDFFHHIRSKRQDKFTNPFNKRRIRDVRDINGYKVLNGESPAISPTESKLENAGDNFQQMLILLQDIEKKISSLSNEANYDNSKEERFNGIAQSGVIRRQSNLFQPMPLTIMPNIPLKDVSAEQTARNLEDGGKKSDSSPNSSLQNLNVEPDYLKRVLNISLQNMDQKQTLDFVVNALINNNNFVESLAKDITLNQTNMALKSSIERANSNTGQSVGLIIVIIFLIVIVLLLIWNFLGTTWVSPTSNVFPKTKDICFTAKKTEKKKSSSEAEGYGEETDSSVDVPHMSLKNVIRKSVVEDQRDAIKESTRDLMKRATTEDYISVEGFMKWNKNWNSSSKESNREFINEHRKSKVPQNVDLDSRTSNENMKQKKRMSKLTKALEKESRSPGSIDDLANVIGRDL